MKVEEVVDAPGLLDLLEMEDNSGNDNFGNGSATTYGEKIQKTERKRRLKFDGLRNGRRRERATVENPTYDPRKDTKRGPIRSYLGWKNPFHSTDAGDHTEAYDIGVKVHDADKTHTSSDSVSVEYNVNPSKPVKLGDLPGGKILDKICSEVKWLQTLYDKIDPEEIGKAHFGSPKLYNYSVVLTRKAGIEGKLPGDVADEVMALAIAYEQPLTTVLGKYVFEGLEEAQEYCISQAEHKMDEETRLSDRAIRNDRDRRRRESRIGRIDGRAEVTAKIKMRDKDTNIMDEQVKIIELIGPDRPYER